MYVLCAREYLIKDLLQSLSKQVVFSPLWDSALITSIPKALSLRWRGWLFNIHPVNAPLSLLAALFGTTLAPIAGRYGYTAGVIAGALHMFLVGNLSFLHAGMNLYNNGFSGGFIAAMLFPLLEVLEETRKARKNRPPSA